MPRPRIGVRLHIVGTGGDTAVGDQAEQVGVLVPRARPRFGEIHFAVFVGGGVEVADGRGMVAQDLRHAGIDAHPVVFGEDLRGVKPGERAGEGETDLYVRGGGGGLFRTGREGERVDKVQVADQVQRGALPAGGCEDGGIPRIAGLPLPLDDPVQIDLEQQKEGKDHQRHQDKHDGLSAVPAPHHFASSR